MERKDFDFELPQELIAQTPIKDRSASKLLVVDKETHTTEHKHFYDVIDYLGEGDVLVLNNTKVLPARLYGDKLETGAKVELLLLEDLGKDVWEVLVGNARVVKVGTVITIADGLIEAECLEIKDGGIRIFKMSYEGVFLEVLAQIGEMPLPPYIHERLEDQDRYQTVYAKYTGSAAAPTAGLHFTQDLLNKIKAKGIRVEYVTLHVGLGTFLPMKTDNLTDHHMHKEKYEMTQETADVLNAAKLEGRNIIAVGTTSGRTLESVYKKFGEFKEDHDATDIFIYPGIKVESFNMMITNFHLPMSTLIMFISAILTRDFTLEVYQEAIDHRYRFFSFGDAMLIR